MDPAKNDRCIRLTDSTTESGQCDGSETTLQGTDGCRLQVYDPVKTRYRLMDVFYLRRRDPCSLFKPAWTISYE